MIFRENLDFGVGSIFDMFWALTLTFLRVPGTGRYTEHSPVNIIFLKSVHCSLLSLLGELKFFAVCFLEILWKTGLLHD
jgi:hypothetical protein